MSRDRECPSDVDVVVTGGDHGRTESAHAEFDVHLPELIRFIGEISSEPGAAISDVIDLAVFFGIDRTVAEHGLEKLRRTGGVYEPVSGRVMLV